MNLSFFIARKYFLSRRKKNFINIISMLSMVIVGVVTAALIIVLSVFNGLEELLTSLNNSFDPQIKVEAAAGKTFQSSDSLLTKIKTISGVKIVTEVIEDYALIRYRDANQIVTLKGVSNNFIEQDRIPEHNITMGKLQLHKGDVAYALVGQGISNNLTLAVNDPMFALQIYYIKNGKTSTTDPSSLYSRKSIVPGGVFSIIQNIDDNYVIVPLEFARELLNAGNKRTSLEIKVKDNVSLYYVQKELQQLLGDKFRVLNPEEQHQDLYKLLKFEKLFTFLAFVILLGIGSINVFFSLMMLVIEKKKDISVLSAMGANQRLIRNIFLAEGALISLSGAFAGLLLGCIISWFQQQYGFVSMGMETSVTDGYPIKTTLGDVLVTAVVVTLITFLISARPAILAARSVSPQHI